MAACSCLRTTVRPSSARQLPSVRSRRSAQRTSRWTSHAPRLACVKARGCAASLPLPDEGGHPRKAKHWIDEVAAKVATVVIMAGVLLRCDEKSHNWQCTSTWKAALAIASPASAAKSGGRMGGGFSSSSSSSSGRTSGSSSGSRGASGSGSKSGGCSYSSSGSKSSSSSGGGTTTVSGPSGRSYASMGGSVFGGSGRASGTTSGGSSSSSSSSSRKPSSTPSYSSYSSGTSGSGSSSSSSSRKTSSTPAYRSSSSSSSSNDYSALFGSSWGGTSSSPWRTAARSSTAAKMPAATLDASASTHKAGVPWLMIICGVVVVLVMIGAFAG